MTETERSERAFKRKARSTRATARLISSSDPNGAANRAYYCLYQALVGEFERLGVKPQEIDAGAARAHTDDERLKYTHSFVKRNASLAGLDGRQCTILKLAYDLRIGGDYGDVDVNESKLQDVLDQLEDILEGLGVNV